MNELLFIIFLLLYFGFGVVVCRLYGRDGAVVLFLVSIIVCNVEVLKQVTLFGLQATLGNIPYGMTFWTTDFISETKGKKESQKTVMYGFIALLLFTLTMRYALIYIPGPEDFAQAHLSPLFSFVPRVVIASFTAYFVAQFHDIWLFHLLRDAFKARYLWLRNNIATILSQLWDTLIFCTIAFLGVFSLPTLLQIYLTTWLIKAFVALLDTPFIYLAVAGSRREQS